jgi:uncharacterized protein (TIGR02996 family)
MPATRRLEPSRFLTSLMLKRDDAHAFMVYGDWLEQQGDPRGELIALQQMLGTSLEDDDLRRYLASYLWRHRSLVPAIDPWRVQLHWKWGFITAAHIDQPTVEEIDRLISHPSCVLLQVVTVARPKPGVRTRMDSLRHISMVVVEP